ncbi:MAG TPA: hypothetical protein VN666_18615 [Nitrospira sp.]|nr:hypothetical protein [Nitrospira sp.]
MNGMMKGRNGRKVSGLIIGLLGLWLLSAGGCAGNAPKPAPTMMQDQVREHADKTFDKLKQEEKNRPVGSGVGPY